MKHHSVIAVVTLLVAVVVTGCSGPRIQSGKVAIPENVNGIEFCTRGKGALLPLPGEGYYWQQVGHKYAKMPLGWHLEYEKHSFVPRRNPRGNTNPEYK